MNAEPRMQRAGRDRLLDVLRAMVNGGASVAEGVRRTSAVPVTPSLALGIRGSSTWSPPVGDQGKEQVGSQVPVGSAYLSGWAQPLPSAGRSVIGQCLTVWDFRENDER